MRDQTTAMYESKAMSSAKLFTIIFSELSEKAEKDFVPNSWKDCPKEHKKCIMTNGTCLPHAHG